VGLGLVTPFPIPSFVTQTPPPPPQADGGMMASAPSSSPAPGVTLPCAPTDWLGALPDGLPFGAIRADNGRRGGGEGTEGMPQGDEESPSHASRFPQRIIWSPATDHPCHRLVARPLLRRRPPFSLSPPWARTHVMQRDWVEPPISSWGANIVGAGGEWVARAAPVAPSP